MSYRITDQCVLCGACVGECLENAIILDEERCYINSELCTDCGSCSAVCIVRAIEAD